MKERKNNEEMYNLRYNKVFYMNVPISHSSFRFPCGSEITPRIFISVSSNPVVTCFEKFQLSLSLD